MPYFCLILQKVGQNVCIDDISYCVENGSCQVTRSNLKKKSAVRSRGHIFCPILLKDGQNVCLYMISLTTLKIGHIRSETRSLDQIFKKESCVHCRGHIFCPIPLKFGRMFVLTTSPTKLKVDHIRSKTM